MNAKKVLSDTNTLKCHYVNVRILFEVLNVKL